VVDDGQKPSVHKDFHGALSFGLAFVESQYGEEGMAEFLESLADSVYAPLVRDIRAGGLAALEEYWRKVFEWEEGDVDIALEDGVLTLAVNRCPAIAHMKEYGYAIAPHFCEHTRIVNEAICRAAGYAASVEYDQDAGRCTQTFRRAEA